MSGFRGAALLAAMHRQSQGQNYTKPGTHKKKSKSKCNGKSGLLLDAAALQVLRHTHKHDNNILLLVRVIILYNTSSGTQYFVRSASNHRECLNVRDSLTHK